MDWVEVVTIVVAAYVAGLGTFKLLIGLRERKPRVNVKFSIGLLELAPGHLSETMIFLEAANPGQKSVTLSSVSFLLPNKQQVIFLSPRGDLRFPFELLPGKKCQIWTEAGEFADKLKEQGYSRKAKIAGMYKDQLGNSYKSKHWSLDIEKLARLGGS